MSLLRRLRVALILGSVLLFLSGPIAHALQEDPAASTVPAPPTSSQVVFEVDAPIAVAAIAEQVQRDVEWLASPDREGRGPGTRGLREAGDFIADRFKSLGLQPALGQDAFFQDVPLGETITTGKETSLVVAGVELKRGVDYHGMPWAKAGAFSGPLAFAGYAVREDAAEYDDFAGIDLNGRVVLAMRYEPHTSRGGSRFSFRGWSGEAALARKARRAADAGAAALLLITPPHFHENAGELLPEEGHSGADSPIPVFHITPDAADRLLTQAGSDRSLMELQKQIDESAKPLSRGFDLQVNGALAVDRVPIIGRNVVALFPGKGARAHEYIVVGAHYDHLGHGGQGSLAPGSSELHPGADDNASGSAALLALAEQMTRSGPRERSILFVAFTFEEEGLIGSKLFVRHLPVPRERIVAMLNFDMVGRVRNHMLFVGGGGTHEWFTPVVAAADERSPLTLASIGRGGRGPSDHQSFSAEGIPVLFLFTGLHRDYHRPGDTPDKVNFEGVAQVVRFAFDVLGELCQMPQKPYDASYDAEGVNTNVRSGDSAVPEPRRGVLLGIAPEQIVEENSNGVRVAEVVAGGPAAEAGLQKGDIIIRIDDQPMANPQALHDFLRPHKPGDIILITFVRNGEEQKVEVTLIARPQ